MNFFEFLFPFYHPFIDNVDAMLVLLPRRLRDLLLHRLEDSPTLQCLHMVAINATPNWNICEGFYAYHGPLTAERHMRYLDSEA